MDEVLQTPKPFTSYFQIQDSLTESVSSTIYKGINLADNEQIIVLIKKYPFKEDSQELKSYLERIKKIDEIDPPITEMRNFGVDSEGYAFLTLPSNLKEAVINSRGDDLEKYRRLFSAYRIIDRLHKNNIVCGDISLNSFWTTAQGDINLIILQGLSESFFALNIDLIPEILLQFVAPEVLTNRSFDKRSDVFSLGVLGLYLYKQIDPFIISIDNGIPSYSNNQACFEPDKTLDEALLSVFRKAVSFDPDSRFPSANELLEALVGAKEKSNLKVSNLGDKIIGSKNDTKALVTKPLNLENKELVSSESIRRKKEIIPTKFLIIAIILALLSLIFIIYYFQKDRQQKLAQNLKDATSPFVAGNPELQNIADKMSNLSIELSQKTEELKSLTNSADPLAYSLIVAGFFQSQNTEYRKAHIDALVNRLKRENLQISANQLAQWYKFNQESSNELLELVFKTLNPIMPATEKAVSLEELLKTDLNIGMRLLASVYFDLDNEELLRPLFVKYIGENLKLKGLENISTIAFLIYHEGLAQIFEFEIRNNLDKLNNGDLIKIINLYSKRNDSGYWDLIKIAKDRELFTEDDLFILDVISNDKNLKTNLVQGLLAIVTNNLTKTDLNVIASWTNPISKDILFLATYRLDDKNLIETAIDLVTVNHKNVEPAISLLNWLKEKKWEERVTFAKSLAVLSVSKKRSQADIDSALDQFSPYLKEKNILSAFTNCEDSRIIIGILKKYPNSVNLGVQLALLKNQDSEIRKAVIPTIITNDIGAMKIIVDAFEKEKDQETKALYRSSFWFLEQR